MTHEVSIAYEGVFAARPWYCSCSCGWQSAHPSEKEAIESKRIHLAQQAER
jgi:hypothetical protein